MQTELIERLKEYEKALNNSAEVMMVQNGLEPESGWRSYVDEHVKPAIADLRALIKEAEGQEPDAAKSTRGYFAEWHKHFTASPWRDEWSPRYAALGEKPVEPSKCAECGKRLSEAYRAMLAAAPLPQDKERVE